MTTVGSNAGAGEVQEARILNRVIRDSCDGWEYEADQRHADLIIQETGAEKMSARTHPGGEKKAMVGGEEGESWSGVEATRFRAVAARAKYRAGIGPIFSMPRRKYMPANCKGGKGALADTNQTRSIPEGSS